MNTEAKKIRVEQLKSTINSLLVNECVYCGVVCKTVGLLEAKTKLNNSGFFLPCHINLMLLLETIGYAVITTVNGKDSQLSIIKNN